MTEIFDMSLKSYKRNKYIAMTNAKYFATRNLSSLTILDESCLQLLHSIGNKLFKSYIYIIARNDISATNQLLLQISLSVFDMVWNNIIAKTVYRFPGLLRSKNRISIHLTLLIFNTILAPILCIIVTDRNCFLDLFANDNEIVTQVSYQYCYQITSDWRDCETYKSLDLTTSFTPPFEYSYQCSSYLITTFVPSLMFTYAYIAFAVTIVFGAAIFGYSFSEEQKNAWWFTRVNQYMPLLYPNDSNLTGANLSSAFAARIIVARILHHITLLLTFGIASPLLAATIGISICYSITMWLLLFGKYFSLAFIIIDRNDISSFSSSFANIILPFDKLCRDVWEGPRNGSFIIISITSIFFALHFIDIGGDKLGWKQAFLSMSIPLLCFPLLLKCFHRYISPHLVRKYIAAEFWISSFPSLVESVRDTSTTIELRNTQISVHCDNLASREREDEVISPINEFAQKI